MEEMTPEEKERLIDEYMEIIDDDNSGKVVKKRALRKVIELMPDYYDLQIQLIMLDFDVKNKNNIERTLEKIEEVQKKVEDELTELDLWKHKGEFWLYLETRPYMNILKLKVDIYNLSGKIEDSIKLCNRIIELNKSDNLGVRYILIGNYAVTGDLKNALKLYKKYPEDSTSFLLPFAYLYFTLGKEQEALGYLIKLNKANRYILNLFKNGISYLLDLEIPDYYSFGDQNEAITVLWENHYVYKNLFFTIFVEDFLKCCPDISK